MVSGMLIIHNSQRNLPCCNVNFSLIMKHFAKSSFRKPTSQLLKKSRFDYMPSRKNMKFHEGRYDYISNFDDIKYERILRMLQSKICRFEHFWNKIQLIKKYYFEMMLFKFYKIVQCKTISKTI